MSLGLYGLRFTSRGRLTISSGFCVIDSVSGERHVPNSIQSVGPSKSAGEENLPPLQISHPNELRTIC